MPLKTINDQVSKKWETYAPKDAIIYQHLEPFDNAQEALAQYIACIVVLGEKSSSVKEPAIEFIKWFVKCIFKVRIKMELFTSLPDDIAFRKKLDLTLTELTDKKYRADEIDLKEYANILFNIGTIYEKLGYSRAERLRTKTRIQSDLQPVGTESQIEMEGFDDEEVQSTQIE